MKRYYNLFVIIIIIILTIPSMLLAEKKVIAELDGFIDPFVVVNAGSGVSAIIDTITVDRGDFIKRGDVIARLDSRVAMANMELLRVRAKLDAEIELQKTRLAFSKRKLVRKEKLFKENAIPFENKDEAMTEMVVLQCQLREAVDRKLIAKLEFKQAIAVFEKHIIRSPVNGVVVERFLSPGEFVDDQPILQIAQLDPLNVEIIASVSLWGIIKEGMSAEVRPESPIEGVYTGYVKIVDNVIDASSGTFGIRVELLNPEYSLPSGLKCRVLFLEEESL